MSVIAWDGKTLAADRQATNNDMRTATRKIWRGANGEGLAITGDLPRGLLLLKWYEEGADFTKYPPTQDSDEWARLIVATTECVTCYERLPVAMRFDDPFTAFGSGRDFAMGAMAMGADARRAVEVASQFNIGCGLGVIAFDL